MPTFMPSVTPVQSHLTLEMRGSTRCCCLLDDAANEVQQRHRIQGL